MQSLIERCLVCRRTPDHKMLPLFRSNVSVVFVRATAPINIPRSHSLWRGRSLLERSLRLAGQLSWRLFASLQHQQVVAFPSDGGNPDIELLVQQVSEEVPSQNTSTAAYEVTRKSGC